MKTDFDQIQQLIQHPQESLSVELKTWIDPTEPDGIAKIVKTVIALRNHNGGYMVFGFNDKTLEPDCASVPPNLRELFHLDAIQSIITKYSSEPFEIRVEFPQRDGQEFPVIFVPPGVRTPVATKSSLGSGNKPLIPGNTIYVRSLTVNDTPSTSQLTWKDLPSLIERCFDNREADIGRFIRRHLGSLSSEQLYNVAAAITGNLQPEKSTKELLEEYFKEGEERFAEVLKERSLTVEEFGVWEVALLLVGQVPEHSPNRDFLNLLSANNPQYTGWPVWLDSRGFSEEARPYVSNDTWEALILGGPMSVEFMRLDPKGRFFLRRTLEDDVQRSPQSPEPRTALDFGLAIYRTAEAIAVGIAFAKAMACPSEETTLAFAFKWTGLRGRYLSAWANPGRFMPVVHRAYQDTVVTQVTVPLETPLSALSQYVTQAIQPLFSVFEAFEMNSNVIEDLTRNLLERRM